MRGIDRPARPEQGGTGSTAEPLVEPAATAGPATATAEPAAHGRRRRPTWLRGRRPVIAVAVLAGSWVLNGTHAAQEATQQVEALTVMLDHATAR